MPKRFFIALSTACLLLSSPVRTEFTAEDG